MGGKSMAQEVLPHVVPVTVFYDENWKVTIKQKASYIRLASLDTTTFKFNGTVKDFYGNGSPLLQMNFGPNGREGSFYLMYSNKKPDRQGVFFDNKPTGKWSYFYPNGKPLQTIEFLTNGDFKVISFFDSTGQQLVKDGTGPWSSKLVAKVGAMNVLLNVSGAWKDSLKTGKWTATQNNGKKLYEEEFEAGQLKKGKLFDVDGKTVYETYKGRENPKLDDMEFLRHAEAFFISDRFLTMDRAKEYILKKEHLLPPSQPGIV